MATNPYISKKVRSEQHLYEDLVIESLKFYGEDVYYLPREIVNKDKIFADDIPSRFSDAYKIETYIENTEGFDGEGDLFTKFGIELRDQATFVFARRRWKKLIGDNLAEVGFRPREGDIIYLPMSNSMFEVLKVETETPFYQLSHLPTFRLQCELFEYSDEDFDTNIAEIDAIEYEGAYQYAVTMHPPEDNTVSITIDDDNLDPFTGKLKSVTLINGGRNYDSAPVINLSAPFGLSKFGNQSFHSDKVRSYSENYLFTSDKGTVEAFFYPNNLPGAGRQALITLGGNTSISDNIMSFGVNDQGKIQFSFRDTLGQDSVVRTLDNDPILASEWSHLILGADSNGSGTISQLYVYLNGVKVFDSDIGRELNFIGNNKINLGSQAPRLYGTGDVYSLFDGKVDELHVTTQSKTEMITGNVVTYKDINLAVLDANDNRSNYIFDTNDSDRKGAIIGEDPNLTMYLGDTLCLKNYISQTVPQPLDFYFGGSFGGARLAGAEDKYIWPNDAEDWGGFNNSFSYQYPIELKDNSRLSFDAYIPSGQELDSAEINFVFEYQSYPDVNPSFSTTEIRIAGDSETNYSVPLPRKKIDTYSSLLMYVLTRNTEVSLRNVKISYIEHGGHPIRVEDSDGTILASPPPADSDGGFYYDSDGTNPSYYATRFTPTEKGNYYYQCTHHVNMRGKISVLPVDINTPVSSFDSNSNTVLLEHFEGKTATLTTTETDGVVTSVVIADSGFGYSESPLITTEGNLDSSDFLIGEIVTQVNPSYTLKGEVTRWSDSDRILQLAHVGSTDGTYKEFSTSNILVGSTSGAKWSPLSVEDMQQQIQTTSQSKVFDDFEADFLDFSESNPFGDMT
jgi:hypothetical protein